jgi:E3 ubiquitin-protein ligase RNF144
MDPRTAIVAIQLQLGDIAEILEDLQDTQKPADNERASLKTIQQDLVQQLATLEGQVLVIKLLKAEFGQRAAYKKLLEEERQAVKDHQFALSLEEMSTNDTNHTSHTDHKAHFNAADTVDDDPQWEMAKDLYKSAFKGDNIHPRLEEEPVPCLATDGAKLHEVCTSAAEPANTEVLGSKTFTKCNACMEIVAVKNTLRLQCQHTYCRACLVDLFTNTISDTTLFPPRCCRVPIPLSTCRTMLSKEYIKEFDLKVEELATPNPTYCANADCSEFIQTKYIVSDVAKCVFCKDKTCAQCKQRSHKGLCPSDPHVQLLMDVAKRSKWQQCTKCNKMEELTQGCFHMT